MKSLLPLLFLTISAVCATPPTGTQSENPSTVTGIFGHWIGIAPDNTKIEYTFSDDGKVVWTVAGHSIHAKFITKQESKLTQIDIFEFDLPQLEGVRFLGIGEITKNKMKFFGVPSKAGKTDDGSPATRPTFFGNEAIIFDRLD